MKHILKLIALFFSLLSCQTAQSAPSYDPIWTPVSESQIRSGIERYSHDSLALYQLWRRTHFQSKDVVFFDQLNQQIGQEPQNGLLLSMRCTVYLDNFLSPRMSLIRFSNRDRSSETQRKILEQAKQLSPRLWLNYTNESDLLNIEDEGTSLPVIKKQIALCRKAVALARNASFPQRKLAHYMLSYAIESKTSDSLAVATYKHAQNMLPRNADPSFGLEFYYRVVKIDPEKQQEAARGVVATIPPNFRPTPGQRKMFREAKIPVPPEWL